MKASNIFILLCSIINPLILYLTKETLVSFIILEILLLLFLLRNSDSLPWVLFFFGFQFYGISFLGIKIYDLTFLFISFWIALKRPSLFSKFNPNRINYSLLSGIILTLYSFVMLLHQSGAVSLSDSFVEAARYIFCMLILWVFLKLPVSNYTNLFNKLTFISLSNLIHGVFIFFLFKKNLISESFSNDIVEITLFAPTIEPRLAGFFSDPNKYYLFFTSLIFLCETAKTGRKKHYGLVGISLLAMGLSLSRIALIIVCLYLLFKLAKYIIKRRLYPVINYTTVIAIVTFIVTLPWFLSYYDHFVKQFTLLIGRADSLRYSSSLSDDSRINAWKLGIDVIQESPIFGHTPYFWQSFYYMPPHNTILSILLDLGLIGLILFLITFKKILKVWYKDYILILFVIPLLILDLQTFRLNFLLLAFFFIENKHFPLNENFNSRPSTIG